MKGKAKHISKGIDAVEQWVNLGPPLEDDSEIPCSPFRAEGEDLMFAQHWRLVPWVIHKLIRYRPAVLDWDDLYQEGFLGLLHAIRHYEHDHNAKFSTYAIRCIRGYALRSIAIAHGSKGSDWRRVVALSKIRRLSMDVSLPGKDGQLTPLSQLLEAPKEDPLAALALHDQAALLERALATLAPRQQAIAKARLRGEILETIAQRHGLTRERIRQIADKVWDTLRRKMKDQLYDSALAWVTTQEATT